MWTVSACWLKTPLFPWTPALSSVLASLPISMLLKAASPDSSVESVVRLVAWTLSVPPPAVMTRFVPPRSTLWHSLVSVAFLIAEVMTRTWPPVSCGVRAAVGHVVEVAELLEAGAVEFGRRDGERHAGDGELHPQSALGGEDHQSRGDRGGRHRHHRGAAQADPPTSAGTAFVLGVESVDAVASEDEAMFCSLDIDMQVGLQRARCPGADSGCRARLLTTPGGRKGFLVTQQ